MSTNIETVDPLQGLQEAFLFSLRSEDKWDGCLGTISLVLICNWIRGTLWRKVPWWYSTAAQQHTQANAACIALLHCVHTDVVGNRESWDLPDISGYKAMDHSWTPVDALTQAFIAILSCCVYVSHSVTTSQDNSHGVEKRNVYVWQKRESERQKCPFEGQSPFLRAELVSLRHTCRSLTGDSSLNRGSAQDQMEPCVYPTKWG